MSRRKVSWCPDVRKGTGIVYLAIADAIAEDIRRGRLTPGQRLPPQRALAERLGVDFTTVSRAYAEAGRRGLVDGRVGQGTFVRDHAVGHGMMATPDSVAPRLSETRLIDMSMNQPPVPADARVLDRMRRTLAGHASGLTADALFHYPGATDMQAFQEAGVHWLSGRLPGLAADRVLVAPGTQGALTAALIALTKPGDTICTELLTYPGIRSLALHLGLRLVGAPMDGDGLDPDAFDALCRRETPKVLYCTPTHHNPTTATMPRERRQAIADLARQHGVTIVEDDVYGRLPADSPPPIAALAPDVTYHIAGLTKCMAPALRVAYLIAPAPRLAAAVSNVLRSSVLSAAPLAAGAAAALIQDGTADAVLSALRTEAVGRQALAARILPPDSFTAQPDSYHLWLRLPASWSRTEFVLHMRDKGIVLAVSDAFTVSGTPPEAARVCLGAAPDRAATQRVLETIADAIARAPASAAAVI